MKDKQGHSAIDYKSRITRQYIRLVLRLLVLLSLKEKYFNQRAPKGSLGLM